MTPIPAVSPPETIAPFSSRETSDTKGETKHAETPGNPGVSPETISDTKPQIVSSSRLFSLLERSRTRRWGETRGGGNYQ